MTRRQTAGGREARVRHEGYKWEANVDPVPEKDHHKAQLDGEITRKVVICPTR